LVNFLREKTEMRILLIALAALVLLASMSCERRNVADSAITANVKSKLAVDPETSALKIKVDTDGGVVTLAGAVPTQAEKAQAEQIARNTEGVTRVINNITVAPNTTGENGAGVTAEDLMILSKIRNRYVAEGIVGANVEVTDGVVTLKGNVENAQSKVRAESIARATSGVKNVNNLIVVNQ
jgi:hyperosmotically inducible periplasmic protein